MAPVFAIGNRPVRNEGKVFPARGEDLIQLAFKLEGICCHLNFLILVGQVFAVTLFCIEGF